MPWSAGSTTVATGPGMVLTNLRGTGAGAPAHPSGKDFGGVIGSVEIPCLPKGRPLLSKGGPPTAIRGTLAKPEQSGTTIACTEGSNINRGAVGRRGAKPSALLAGNVKPPDDAIR